MSAHRTLAVCILLTVCFLAPAGAEAQGQTPKPEISVLNTEPLKVTGTKGEDSVEVKFSVLNGGDSDVEVIVAFQASSSETATVASVSPSTIPAGEARRLTVTLSGVSGLSEAVTGQLVIKGGEPPVAQSVEINPPSPDSAWPAILIGGSLALAVLVAAMVVGSLGTDRPRLTKAAPNPKWSFSSWATTLTAAGAAFGTVLGAATFPPFPDHVSKSELVNLNILFGLIVLAGPFLFETLRGYKVDEKEAKVGRTGTNLTLLIASAFTLWAVVGQLGTFGLLGWELLGGKGWAMVAAFASFAFILLGAWYYFTTTSEQVRRDWAKEEADAKKKEQEEREAGHGCCPKPVQTRSWPLL